MAFVDVVPEEKAEELSLGDTLEVICSEGNRIVELEIFKLEKIEAGVQVNAKTIRGEEEDE